MKKGTIIILFVVGLIILYLYIFWGKRPFGEEVTQDRPFAKWLCLHQAGCNVAIVDFPCSDDSNRDENIILRRWNGFKGCNNYTLGYRKEDNTIKVEFCGCGGLM